MTTDPIIRWEDPPPSKTRGGGRWVNIGEALKARPGIWALLAEDASPGQVANIKKAVPGLEVVSRRNTVNGYRYKIYARWPLNGAAS